jgi:hypothetical protein
MQTPEIALLFSGGPDSLALYALAALGHHPELRRPRHIHLLHMHNGMRGDAGFPRQRFEAAQQILAGQVSTVTRDTAKMAEATLVELDMVRLFQKEISLYLDDMIPKVIDYVECRLAGRIRETAAVFPSGRE